MFTTNIKLNNKRDFVFDTNLRKIVFDLANADNFGEQDFYPNYQKYNFSKFRVKKQKIG